MTIWIPIALVGLLALGACTTAQKAFVDVGIEKTQDGFDTTARVLKADTCAMSLGAYHRVNTEEEKAALDVLCNPHR